MNGAEGNHSSTAVIMNSCVIFCSRRCLHGSHDPEMIRIFQVHFHVTLSIFQGNCSSLPSNLQLPSPKEDVSERYQLGRHVFCQAHLLCLSCGKRRFAGLDRAR